MSDLRERVIYLSRFDYNCGGFALETFDWFVPYCQIQFHNTYELIYMLQYGEMFDEDYADQEIIASELNYDLALEHCVENMKRALPIRQINSEDEVEPHEAIVLFRLAYDDYHFVRKFGDRYFHKTGARPTILEMSKEEVYDDHWIHRYDSDIIILALEKQDDDEEWLKFLVDENEKSAKRQFEPILGNYEDENDYENLLDNSLAL